MITCICGDDFSITEHLYVSCFFLCVTFSLIIAFMEFYIRIFKADETCMYSACNNVDADA
jgi:hypothetical protein